MAFKEAIVILVPKTEPQQHCTSIVLPHFEFYVVLVPDVDTGVCEAVRLVEEKGVHVVNLCGGFGNADVGMVAQAVGSRAAVAVARCDHPGSQIVCEAIRKACW